MPIDPELVRYLERLAALRLTEGEREVLTRHLQRILAYVDQLAELDTTAVEPCRHVGDLTCPLRPDTRQPSLPAAEALAGSPAASSRFFVVPPVFPADGSGEDDA